MTALRAVREPAGAETETPAIPAPGAADGGRDCPFCHRPMDADDGLTCDMSQNIVAFGNVWTRLSPMEMKIFEILYRRRPCLVAVQSIYDSVYLDSFEGNYIPHDNMVRVHLLRIRRKIRPLGWMIGNQYGGFYWLEPVGARNA